SAPLSVDCAAARQLEDQPWLVCHRADPSAKPSWAGDSPEWVGGDLPRPARCRDRAHPRRCPSSGEVVTRTLVAAPCSSVLYVYVPAGGAARQPWARASAFA